MMDKKFKVKAQISMEYVYDPAYEDRWSKRDEVRYLKNELAALVAGKPKIKVEIEKLG
jgi:hypothetical protein